MYVIKTCKFSPINLLQKFCLHLQTRHNYLKNEGQFLHKAKESEIKRSFLLGCLGAADGKHLAIESPCFARRFYYEGCHSLLMMKTAKIIIN